jgi:hypothetical protein
MSMRTYPPRLRDADTYNPAVALTQALLADMAVTGDKSVNGYEGVGTRVYPEANINPDISGKGQEFPYLIVTTAVGLAPFDYTSGYLEAVFDVTAVDRGHTPTNVNGGTQNVVGVIAAAYARLVNNPLTATGYANLSVAPESEPRGTTIVTSGAIIRQRAFSVRVKGIRV